MKKKTGIIVAALFLFVIAVVAYVYIQFSSPSKLLVGEDPDIIYEAWGKVNYEHRRDYVHALLGDGSLEISEITLVPQPKRSLLWGDTRSEVISKLGKPDGEVDDVIYYNIGPAGGAVDATRRAVVPGFAPGDEYLAFYFDQESGKVKSIAIQD